MICPRIPYRSNELNRMSLPPDSNKMMDIMSDIVSER